MPRNTADSLTGERTLRLRLKISQEELDLIAEAASVSGEYRDTWARDTLVREARKLLKKQGLSEKA